MVQSPCRVLRGLRQVDQGAEGRPHVPDQRLGDRDDGRRGCRPPRRLRPRNRGRIRLALGILPLLTIPGQHRVAVDPGELGVQGGDQAGVQARVLDPAAPVPAMEAIPPVDQGGVVRMVVVPPQEDAGQPLGIGDAAAVAGRVVLGPDRVGRADGGHFLDLAGRLQAERRPGGLPDGRRDARRGQRVPPRPGDRRGERGHGRRVARVEVFLVNGVAVEAGLVSVVGFGGRCDGHGQPLRHRGPRRLVNVARRHGSGS